MSAYLHEILALHFDPEWGTPYWLQKRSNLGFNPLEEIQDLVDLNRFPVFPTGLLAERPVTDFIPRRYRDQLHRFVTAETGGTTGPPKRTAYLDADFEAAFVTPFVTAAKLTGFPRDRNWLFIGPSGPHIIGKAARACATALGSIDPFSVDFDPRWVRKLVPGSMARTRYTEHVLTQAEAILRTQDIGVLFTTPPVLTALGTRLPETVRSRITGVHLGGMATDAASRAALSTIWFPNAVALGGYGNSLAGVCPELAPDPAQPPAYFAHGERLQLDVVQPDDENRGRVRFHRLDRSGFFPNVLERDEAAAVARPDIAGADDFCTMGLGDPRPARQDAESTLTGLY